MQSVLRQRIEAVKHKSMPELREQFQELFGFASGETSYSNLRKRIIYRMQELYYGGLNDADIAFLNAVADKDPLAKLQRQPKRSATVTGTKLFRIWKGKEYEVTVMPHGKYQFNGKKYRSLSSIARTITGTRWNGKKFFGVKN